MATEPKDKNNEKVDPVVVPNEIKEEQDKREEASKNKTDYFASQLATGFQLTLGDYFQSNIDPEELGIQDKESYWATESIQEFYKSRDLDREDFENDYDKALTEYNNFVQDNYDRTKITTRRYVDNAFNRGNNAPVWRQNFRNKTLFDTDFFKTRTMKEIGIDLYGIWDEELEIYSKKDLDSKSFLFDDPVRVARHIDKNGDFKFKGDALYNLPFLEKFSSGEESLMQDQNVTVFNRGMWKDTLFDANKLEESFVNTAVRAIPNFVPYVRVIPFLFSGLEGLNSVVKSINDLTGQSEGLDRATNKMENFINKLKFDQTEKEKASLFNIHSLINGVAMIYTQLPGMKAVSKGGAWLTDFTRGTLKKGFIPINGSKVFVGTEMARKVGGVMGLSYMGAMASHDVSKLADANGLSKEHAALVHLAAFLGLSSVASISQKVLTQLGAYPTESAAIYRKIIGDSVAAQFGKTGAAAWANPKNLKGLMRWGSIMGHRTGVALEKMGEFFAKNPSGAKVFYGGLMEGLEEVTEDAYEQGVKSAYNIFFSDDNAEHGKGMFEKFDMADFAQRSLMSFTFGALGGGLAASKWGALSLGMDYDAPGVKNKVAIALDPVESRKYDKALKNFKYGSTELSVVKDDKGKYLPVSKDSPDPLRKISHRDFAKSIEVARWEFIKNIADFQLMEDMESDIFKELKKDPNFPYKNTKEWDASLKMQLNDYLDPKDTLIYDDINNHLEDYIQKSVEIQQLKEELTKVDPNDPNHAAIKAKIENAEELQKNTSKLIKDTASGKYTDKYLQEALFEYNVGSNRNIEDEKNNQTIAEVNIMNSTFARNKEDELKKIEEANIQKEQRSQAILRSSTIDEAWNVIKDSPKHPLSPAAKKHLTLLLEQEAIDLDEILADIQQGTTLGETMTREESLSMIKSQIGGNPNNYLQYIDKLLGDEKPPAKFTKALEKLKKTRSLISNNTIESIPENIVMDEIGLFMLDEDGVSLIEQIEQERIAAKEEGYSSNSLRSLALKLGKKANQILVLRAINPKINEFKKKHSKLYDTNPVETFEHATDEDLENISNYIEQSLDEIIGWASLSDSNIQNPMAVINKHSINLIINKANDLRPILERYFAGHTEFIDQIHELLDVISESKDRIQEEGGSPDTVEDVSFLEAIFKEDVDIITKVEKLIYDYYNSLTLEQKQSLVANNFQDLNGSRVQQPGFRYFLSTLRLDTSVFYGEMESILKDEKYKDKSAPTYEQLEAIRCAYGKYVYNIKSEEGEVDPVLDEAQRLTNDYGKVEGVQHIIYIDGSWGSGKTEYVAGPLSNLLMQLIGSKGPSKVMVAGNQIDQAQKLKAAVESWGNSAILSSDNSGTHQGILKQLQEGAESMSDVGVIVLDEATYIKLDDDLKNILKAVAEINVVRKNKKLPPLYVVTLGDHQQEGYVEAKGGSIVTTNNIKGEPAIERTPQLKHVQRASYESLQKMLAAIRQWKANISKNRLVSPSFTSNYGLDEDGNLAGYQVVHLPQTEVGKMDMSNIETKKEAIRQVLKHSEGKSIVYITDKSTTSEDIAAIISDPEFSKIANNIKHPHEIQGGERDLVIVDMETTASPRTASPNSEEMLVSTRLGMSASRASNFALIFDNSPNGDRDWKDADMKDQKKVASKISEDEYTRFKEQTLEYIGRLSTTKPDAPGGKLPPVTRNNKPSIRKEANKLYKKILGNDEDTKESRDKFRKVFDRELEDLDEFSKDLSKTLDDSDSISLKQKMDDKFVYSNFFEHITTYLDTNTTLLKEISKNAISNHIGLSSIVSNYSEDAKEKWIKEQEEKDKDKDKNFNLQSVDPKEVEAQLSQYNKEGRLPLFTWVAKSTDGKNRSVARQHLLKQAAFGFFGTGSKQRQILGKDGYKVVLKMGHIKDFLEHTGSVQFTDYEALESQGVTHIPYLELQFGENHQEKILLAAFPYFTQERAEKYGNIINMVDSLMSPDLQTIMKGNSDSELKENWPGIDVTNSFFETLDPTKFSIGNQYKIKNPEGKVITVTLDELKKLHAPDNKEGRPVMYFSKTVFGINNPNQELLNNIGYKGNLQDARRATFILYSYDENALDDMEKKLRGKKPKLGPRESRRVGILYLGATGPDLISSAKFFMEYEGNKQQNNPKYNSIFLNWGKGNALRSAIEQAGENIEGSRQMVEELLKSIPKRGKYSKVEPYGLSEQVLKYLEEGTDQEKKMIEAINDFIMTKLPRGIQIFPAASGVQTNEAFLEVKNTKDITDHLISEVSYISSPYYTLEGDQINGMVEDILSHIPDSDRGDQINNDAINGEIVENSDISRSARSLGVEVKMEELPWGGTAYTFSQQTVVGGFDVATVEYKSYDRFQDLQDEFILDSNVVKKLKIDNDAPIELVSILYDQDGNHTITINHNGSEVSIPFTGVNKVNREIVNGQIKADRIELTMQGISEDPDLTELEKKVLISRVNSQPDNTDDIQDLFEEFTSPKELEVKQRLGMLTDAKMASAVNSHLNSKLENDPLLVKIMNVFNTKNC